MNIFTAVLALVAFVTAAPAPEPQAELGPCTPERRIATAMAIIGAFNDPNPARSVATINAAPFKPDSTIDFCINGAPCVRVGYDAQTSKLVAIAAMQAVARVETVYSTFANGSTIMDAEVTFGIGALRGLGLALPAKTKIYVIADFDLADCRIRAMPAYFTLPSELLGVDIQPPFFPDLGLPPVALPITGLLTALSGSMAEKHCGGNAGCLAAL